MNSIVCSITSHAVTTDSLGILNHQDPFLSQLYTVADSDNSLYKYSTTTFDTSYLKLDLQCIGQEIDFFVTDNGI